MFGFSIHTMRAAAAIGRRDFREAIRRYEKHLESNAGDPFTRHMIGQCYEWLGDDEQAIEWATRALAMEADFVPTLELLTRCYARQGDHDRAYRCARRVLRVPVPEPPSLPGWMTGIFRPFRLIRKRRKIEDHAPVQSAANRIARQHAEAQAHARAYTAWYEANREHLPPPGTGD